MTVAELSPWNLLGTEIAFLVFAILVGVGLLFVLAVAMLGLPFWGLSEALHPRLQDALRKGETKRARRLDVAQRLLDRSGEFVVGFVFLGLLGGLVVWLWGARLLVVGVLSLVVLGLLGAIAERLGIINAA